MPPPSPDWSTCSERAIGQCHKGCFAVSALLLISKLDFLYSRLHLYSRQYVDSIRTCPNPKLTSDVCARIPAAIVKRYKEITGKGIDIEKQGGSSVALIMAILQANSVPLTFRSTKDGIPESALPPIVNNGALMVIFEFPKLAKSLQTIKQKILTLAHRDGRIRGGLISLEQQGNPPPGTSHASHAIAFTICKGKLVICNYGECQSVNRKAKYAIKQDRNYAVRMVTVLVDTTTPKAAPKSKKPKPKSKKSTPKPKPKSKQSTPKSSKPASHSSYASAREAALKRNDLSFRSEGVTYYRECVETTRFVQQQEGKKTSSKGVCYKKARQKALDSGHLSFFHGGVKYARPTASSTTFVAT